MAVERVRKAWCLRTRWPGLGSNPLCWLAVFDQTDFPRGTIDRIKSRPSRDLAMTQLRLWRLLARNILLLLRELCKDSKIHCSVPALSVIVLE